MNTLPTNVLYDIYCPKSDGSVRGAQKKGGENSPISPPLDPRLFLGRERLRVRDFLIEQH